MNRLVLLALLAFGCAADRERLSPPKHVIEPQGNAGARWVEHAHQIHRLADKAIDGAAKMDALRELVALAKLDAPASVETADEIVTRQDLYGRAAQLAFELDQPDRALELADQGLRLPAVEGPFRRQLFIMAAKVKAARGDNAGSAEAVRAARESLR